MSSNPPILEISALPFYWRLKSEKDLKSPVPERLNFQLEVGESGLVTQKRRPELLDALDTVYQLNYNIGYLQEGYDIALPYRDDFWRYLTRTISGLGENLRILEIGCGGAILLRALRDLGHEVVGIDPSPLSHEAKKKYNLEIHTQLLSSGMDIGTFDLIYSMDVLEHAFDPKQFIEDSLGYLRETGTLIASVPDAGPSIELNEVSMAMHQHLQYFSGESLKTLFDHFGLVSVVERAGYGGSLYCTAQFKSATSEFNEVHNLPKESFDIEVAVANLGAVQNTIQDFLNDGKSTALYAPLRALPYISGIEPQQLIEGVRFIDDTAHWRGRKFDGCDVVVESSDDISLAHPDVVVIFSLTFEQILRKKLQDKQVFVETVSLREMLRG